jgi:hypothetical protein
MATLKEILAEQATLIGEAKQTLEAAQNHPPEPSAPSHLKAATVAELRERMRNLELARGGVEQQIKEQIAAYEREIAALTDQR